MKETTILETYEQGDADVRLALSMAYRDLREEFGAIDRESPVAADRETPWPLWGISGRRVPKDG